MDNNTDVNSFSDVLGELMKNPDLGKMVGELKNKFGESQSEPRPPAENGIGIPPDIMDKLPQIMASLGGGGGGRSEKKNDGGKDMARLLRALKPYLSGRRRDAIESIITVAELGSIAGFLPAKQKPGGKDSSNNAE